MADFKNLFVSFALLALALLLIGSNFQSSGAAAKNDPAWEVVQAMTAEIPQMHQAEWDALAAEDPVRFFRYSIGARSR